jgi:hypothetical protein
MFHHGFGVHGEAGTAEDNRGGTQPAPGGDDGADRLKERLIGGLAVGHVEIADADADQVGRKIATELRRPGRVVVFAAGQRIELADIVARRAQDGGDDAHAQRIYRQGLTAEIGGGDQDFHA